VTFNSKTTNLHSVWDTSLPEKLIGGHSIADAQRWAASITASINNGTYKESSANWLAGASIEDPLGTTMSWARESNALVCSVVMPNGPAAVTDVELAGNYYDSAIATVEEQIAKGEFTFIKKELEMTC
jgi:hypothetical protein